MQKSVTHFAPGKLMVAGDWSVLEEGNSALVMAVDRGVSVSVEPNDVYAIDAQDLGVNNFEFMVNGSFVENAHLTIFKDVFLFFSRIYEGELSPIKVTSRSIISGSALSEKVGFGSSAAFSVALLSALSQFFSCNYSKNDLFKIAYASHYLAQGKKGSGFDIAASVFGGCIEYKRPKVDFLHNWIISPDLSIDWPGLVIRRVQDAQCHFVIGYSGASASTTQLLERMSRFKSQNKDQYLQYIEDLNQKTLTLLHSFERGSCVDVVTSAYAIRNIFKDFQRDSLVGFETNEIESLCDVAEALDGSAKFSGAGGGDSVIAFAPNEMIASEIRKAWKKSGFEVFDVGVDPHGVRAF